MPSLDVYSSLAWRKLIHQTTDEENLPNWLAEAPRTVYAGFDPTSDSLHVGHLVAMMILRRFQKAGHKPIVLAGGATGMIGDPSGRSEERSLLTVEQIEANLTALRPQMQRFLDFDSATSNAATLVNNHDWMGPQSYLEFLRDIGKHFPVNVMLAKDSVKSRLSKTDSGLSYTEFSYMLIQAYDFVHLYREHGCQIQIGGSDQWGNITAGIDLARRLGISEKLFGITTPLLTKSDGQKMGKTASGALWLDPAKTSPYHFYQYWINIDDTDVLKCLPLFTDVEQEELEELTKNHLEAPEKREAQKRLAEDLTQLVHGEEGLRSALTATSIFFGAEIAELSDAELLSIFDDVPSQSVPREKLTDGSLTILDALVLATLAKSKGEARRTVQQGGAYVNNRRIEAIDQVLDASHLVGESTMVLRSGKRRYAVLRFEG